MQLDRKRLVWVGAAAALIVGGAFVYRATFQPSQSETRAFLDRLLVEDRRISARGPDGEMVALEAGRIVGVDAGQCHGDTRERFTRREVPRAFVCRYVVVTPEATRYEAVLRVERIPAGGPAEQAIPGSLVDPGRYRVNSFVMRPVGLTEAQSLLGGS